MYARNTKLSRVRLPAADKEIGFDLIAYDWVAPYGRGSVADFIFKLDKKGSGKSDLYSTLTITFSNRLDGIQIVRENRRNGSKFKLPRFAPDAGYQSSLVKVMTSKPHGALETNFDDENNYIFRIRSEEKDGKLIKAMYGKIQGDIIFDSRWSNTTSASFKYYLNPDFTRNLEFDPTQNLFLGLTRLETVGLD